MTVFHETQRTCDWLRAGGGYCSFPGGETQEFVRCWEAKRVARAKLLWDNVWRRLRPIVACVIVRNKDAAKLANVAPSAH